MPHSPMEDDDDTPLYVPVRVRRRHDAALAAEAKASRKRAKNYLAEALAADAKEELPAEQIPARSMRSLVDVSAQIQEEEGPENEQEAEKQKQQAEEALLLRNIGSERAPLVAAKERAVGVQYSEPMKSSWTLPRHILSRSEQDHQTVRDKYRIVVEGEDVVAPVTRFRDLKLPETIVAHLEAKGISKPTPIQMQGLTVALSGRDMIGIAFTGSGKTLTFCLPMVMFAVEEETKMPLIGGEGPIGLIVCPSRELAQQTFDIVEELSAAASKCGHPRLRSLLCIGGIDMREQIDPRRTGIHMVVATPGRLMSMLSTKRINLHSCRYLCLDEADRLIDLGFEEDMRTVLGYFRAQRQTVMFSATMPSKIKEFAATSLVKPILVNVGRAGAANLDVVQKVEYVKEEDRMVYLLQCLQKTPPPVLIFSSNTSEVDDIEMYLLIKGVEAVAIHGAKSQVDRLQAVKAFKNGTKDVLVATDIAGKGLDFPDIKHVINFDMPSEIEDYVHRIGRTGRRGRTGLATTFINRATSETTLLDLKHLLREAKQEIPAFLLAFEDPSEKFVASGTAGCAYCGGLGHRVTDCPKLAAHHRSKVQSSMGGGGDGLSGGY